MSKKIKIAEIFHSIQGEGLFVGVSSVFIRTFGCNFKCAGFGMPLTPDGDHGDTVDLSTVADDIAIKRKDHPEWTYSSLPLAETGCDSYASWHPKFKDLSPMLTVDEIVNEVEIVRLEHEMAGPINGIKDTHIVITGGEPLLGWQRSYPELLDKLAEAGYRNITFETNGTQAIEDELYDYLMLNHISGKRLAITFSVSPKLSNSGEAMCDACKPNIVDSYGQFGTVYLKFVVATARDVDDVRVFVHEYKRAGFDGEIYLMPVGGTSDVYKFNAAYVAELAMHNGYRYSSRLQVDLWKNAWGT